MAPLILISSEANSGLSLLAKVINMTEQNQDKKQTYNFNKLQKRLRRNVGNAIADFGMIEMVTK